MKKEVIVIAGATAAGKSAVALDVCRQLNGELISCDSMQIYRKMNIGTAKPTREEMAEIPHHLIDIKDPCDDFSSADFASLAKDAIDDIISRGKLPVLCGGTGLYLDSLMFIKAQDSAACDKELREKLLKNDKHENWLKLAEIDPQAAEKIHENNVKRVVRALEIYYLTGKTKTENDKVQLIPDEEYNYRIFVISYKDREKLYDRINKRVDVMVNEGLEEEIRSLIEKGELKEGKTAYQAIGYKEFADYIKGTSTKEEATELLKKATRNYAKRQITWFARYKDAKFVYADEFDDKAEVSSHVVDLIKQKENTLG